MFEIIMAVILLIVIAIVGITASKKTSGSILKNLKKEKRH